MPMKDMTVFHYEKKMHSNETSKVIFWKVFVLDHTPDYSVEVSMDCLPTF